MYTVSSFRLKLVSPTIARRPYVGGVSIDALASATSWIEVCSRKRTTASRAGFQIG